MIDIDRLIQTVRTTDMSVRRQRFDCLTEEDMLNAFVAVARETEPKYVLTKDNKNCITQLVKWLFADPTFKCLSSQGGRKIDGRLGNAGIYLYGNTGCGKTLSITILRRLAKAFNIGFKVGAERVSLSWSTYRADEIVDKYIHGDSLDDIKKARVLCIDDLGTENPEAMYMGTRMNVLKNIIEQRGEYQGCITIITSNIPLDSPDLVRIYGDRVVSRLNKMCNFLVMRGIDHRLNL